MNTHRIFFLVTFWTVVFALLLGSCKKKDEEPVPDNNTPTPTENTVTDIDGNVYQTVKIGNQTWMKSNLKVTKYKDGSPITLITDETLWGNTYSAAFCWYDNNQTANGSTYGALYNWYAVNTGNLCPAGWHVPTSDEWTTLTAGIGGDQFAGGKLKEEGTTHWQTPNQGATNELGFTALPGGNRSNLGAYGFKGVYGYWWTTTSAGTSLAWSRYMNYSNAGVAMNTDQKRAAFSVRCVKD